MPALHVPPIELHDDVSLIVIVEAAYTAVIAPSEERAAKLRTNRAIIAIMDIRLLVKAKIPSDAFSMKSSLIINRTERQYH